MTIAFPVIVIDWVEKIRILKDLFKFIYLLQAHLLAHVTQDNAIILHLAHVEMSIPTQCNMSNPQRIFQSQNNTW